MNLFLLECIHIGTSQSHIDWEKHIVTFYINLEHIHIYVQTFVLLVMIADIYTELNMSP